MSLRTAAAHRALGCQSRSAQLAPGLAAARFRRLTPMLVAATCASHPRPLRAARAPGGAALDGRAASPLSLCFLRCPDQCLFGSQAALSAADAAAAVTAAAAAAVDPPSAAAPSPGLFPEAVRGRARSPRAILLPVRLAFSPSASPPTASVHARPGQRVGAAAGFAPRARARERYR